jgi:predicted TIM-barrel fold metal-dependent hydrolase
MHMVDSIAARHPRQKFVIDHLGLVNGEKDAVAFRGLDHLLVLGKRPNVAVKASALACYTDEKYPYPGLQAQLKRVYDAFGAKRMFWGTDQSRSPIGYRQGIELFTRHTPFLRQSELEWIMGKGIREWLDWKR